VVTGAYYGTLGVNAVVGRLLTRDDDRAGAPPVTVVSHGYWTREFGSRADVVGQPVLINGVPVPIVGVSAPGFAGANVGQTADLTVTVSSLPPLAPGAAPRPRQRLAAGSRASRARPVASRGQSAARDAVAERGRGDARAAVAASWRSARRRGASRAWSLVAPGASW
jgi:MacB-like protein